VTQILYHELDFTGEGCSFANYEEYTIAFQSLPKHPRQSHVAQPKIHDSSRKKEVGLFLDEECDRCEIIGYVGLCSKSYCLLMKQLVDTDHQPGTAQSWRDLPQSEGERRPSRYLSALYRYEDYKNCVLGNLPKTAVESSSSLSRRLPTKTHGYHQQSGSFSFDDKMYHYLEDGVFKSLPHGHYKIAEIRAKNEVPRIGCFRFFRFF
jgi:hypothetical protein